MQAVNDKTVFLNAGVSWQDEIHYIDYFSKHIVYINVLRRMPVDCDCVGIGAAEPTMPDIGILTSTDILAIDQASVDLVYAQMKNHELVEHIE